MAVVQEIVAAVAIGVGRHTAAHSRAVGRMAVVQEIVAAAVVGVVALVDRS